MVESLGSCPRCDGPLIEIDHYSERLIGRGVLLKGSGPDKENHRNLK